MAKFELWQLPSFHFWPRRCVSLRPGCGAPAAGGGRGGERVSPRCPSRRFPVLPCGRSIRPRDDVLWTFGQNWEEAGPALTLSVQPGASASYCLRGFVFTGLCSQKWGAGTPRDAPLAQRDPAPPRGPPPGLAQGTPARRRAGWPLQSRRACAKHGAGRHCVLEML